MEDFDRSFYLDEIDSLDSASLFLGSEKKFKEREMKWANNAIATRQVLITRCSQINHTAGINKRFSFTFTLL